LYFVSLMRIYFIKLFGMLSLVLLSTSGSNRLQYLIGPHEYAALIDIHPAGTWRNGLINTSANIISISDFNGEVFLDDAQHKALRIGMSGNISLQRQKTGSSARETAHQDGYTDKIYAEKNGLVAVEAESYFRQSRNKVRKWYLTSEEVQPEFGRDED